MATMTATTAKHPGPASPTLTLSLFAPVPLFTIAAALRAALLAYGLWQDANSALKYTDIDYLVFTDAARAVARGGSPYARETYRYTPLLAWLLAPSIQLAESLGASGRPAAALAAFSAGKVLFAAADLVAGWLLLKILRRTRTTKAVASSSVAEAFSPGAFAALWLWNPMVATISTRGSSEGLLGVLVAALLCAALEQRVLLAGALLGLGVHFKIYPFVYAPAIVWWMDAERMSGESEGRKPELGATWTSKISAFFTAERILFGASSLVVFLGLNAAMYMIYGMPFVEHTFLHHVSRIDHRHNFSPYNALLYLSSASPAPGLRVESLAFLPQLALSCVLVPLALAKRDLATTMLAQTFAFVAFNKVCTSQYFLWYMVFLPLYLPRSSLLARPAWGGVALALWVGAQAAWLQQAYQLEFLGQSTFVPGLWAASVAFFGVNCWILGVIIDDGGKM